MKIYLVRHAQSAHNANQDVFNPDPSLTELGFKQAQYAAQQLQDFNLNAVALYVSPHRRTLQTAEPIRQALGLQAQILPVLCEAGALGEHAGLTRSQILAEWPGVVPDDTISESGWWWGGREDEKESVFYARAARALADLRNRHAETPLQATDFNIIVVSHGRFGSAFVSTIVGMPPSGYNRFPFDNCGITCIDLDVYNRYAYAPPPPDVDPNSHDCIRLLFHNYQGHIPLELRS